MEEFGKNRIILALVILNVILLIATISATGHARKNRIALEQEANLRFDLEAKESGYAKTVAKLEDKAKVAAQTLEEEKVAHQATKKALVEAKDELEKITKLKEALEEDLKNALVKDKSAKTKNN